MECFAGPPSFQKTSPCAMGGTWKLEQVWAWSAGPIRGRRSRYIKARAYRSLHILRFSRRRILIVLSSAYILTYFMMIESASGRHPMLPYSWTEKRFRRRKNSKHCPRCVKNVAQNIDLALYRLKDETRGAGALEPVIGKVECTHILQEGLHRS
jgi:hypothetical protein